LGSLILFIEFFKFLRNLASLGYLGIFLAELIANSSILFPVPGYLITLAIGAALNPFLAALSAGLGASIGELTGYLLGRGGRKLLIKKLELERIKKIYSKYGLWSIYIFAAFPLPFDIVGMLCGVLKINLIVFFLLTFAGKFTSRMFIAYSGKEVYELLVSFLSGELKINLWSIALISIFSIVALASLIYWRFILKGKDQNGFMDFKLQQLHILCFLKHLQPLLDPALSYKAF
jgi:uncharacterized membrane protein YdjX (TVP38/TMEM64 family)